MEFSTCGLIFYAVQIYPSIVIEDALQLLEDKMSHDAKWAQKMDVSRKEVIKLVRLLIASPFFQCELILVFLSKPRAHHWEVLLIDDTFMNLTESKDRLDNFFAYLNSLYPPIKWTMEKEINRKFHALTSNLSNQDQQLTQWYTGNHQLQIGTITTLQSKPGMKRLQLYIPYLYRLSIFCSTKDLLAQELAHTTQAQVFLDNSCFFIRGYTMHH